MATDNEVRNGATAAEARRAALQLGGPDQAKEGVRGGRHGARIRTMEDIVDRQLSTPTQSTALLGTFAVLALVLASIGIYGVLSYSVMQRTNEIGVRMALGATSGEILFSFVRRGLGLTLCGLAIGWVLAAIASRLLTNLLYGFRPDYIATVAAVSLILAGVATLACFVPAPRASLIDPIIALRQE
jgi:ABC-type antimicrobial peptide transport system permease subunit